MNDGHSTTKEKIYAAMKQEIFECALKPGDVLTIGDLCARFGVSRTPVREALITLCDEGLLDVKQRFGFIVTAVSVKDMVETYSLRILLEKEAVRLAARNMDHDDLQKLKAFIDIPGRPSGRFFHSFIASSSGWGVLAEVLETLMDKSARSRSLFNNFQRRAAGNDFDSKREHSRIYEAIASRNEEEAVSLMEKHLRRSRDYILKIMSMI